MPYIKKEDRARFEQLVSDFSALCAAQRPNAGEMNYLITRLILEWMGDPQTWNYEKINTVSGFMTEALAEFRRRVVGPYENRKIEENGDVYRSNQDQPGTTP